MVSLREKVDVGVENISVVVSETFYYLPEWVRKTTESTESTESTEKNNNSLCPPCPLWLIFFAIIRVHPEKIKKSLILCNLWFYVDIHIILSRFSQPGRTPNILVDSLRRNLSCTHSRDNGRRTGDDIASCKYAGL